MILWKPLFEKQTHPKNTCTGRVIGWINYMTHTHLTSTYILINLYG